MQRSLSGIVGGVYRRSSLETEGDGVKRLALPICGARTARTIGGKHERRLSISRRLIHVCAAIEQDAHHRHVRLPRCAHQWSGTFAQRGITVAVVMDPVQNWRV